MFQSAKEALGKFRTWHGVTFLPSCKVAMIIRMHNCTAHTQQIFHPRGSPWVQIHFERAFLLSRTSMFTRFFETFVNKLSQTKNLTLKFLIRALHFLISFGDFFLFLHGLIWTYMFIHFWENFPFTLFFTQSHH